MNRFHGKGVLKAVNNVNHIIANKLIGIDPTQQTEADQVFCFERHILTLPCKKRRAD